MAGVEATTVKDQSVPREGVSSFAKSLFFGEIHEDLVFPYPLSNDAEQDKVRSLIASVREFAAESIDMAKIEEDGWIGDDVVRGLGERGLCGLYVPEQYGGQGLSQTGYCRVFEAFSQVDASVSVVMGVHQSIGMKGIVMFGSDEQKQRLLPDLASGRKLAAFALTEPEAGSDAYHLQSRAVLQSDGSWLLNGEKRFIGNGSKAGVIVTFARAEVDGRDRHIALILTPDMDGLQVGKRYDTMGLRGNDLRHLYYNDIRVPPENVLGEPGDGFQIAMEVLNNGRMSLGTGSVGAAKKFLDVAIEHVTSRRQFDRPLAEFELVQEKIGWMVVPVRAGVDGLHDHRPRRRGRSGLLAGVGDLQGRRNRVPLVSGQPGAAVGRGRGLPARPPIRAGPARHPRVPNLRGRQRRAACVHRPHRAQAAGREAPGAAGLRHHRSDPLGWRRRRLRRRPDRVRSATSPRRSARGRPVASSRTCARSKITTTTA